MRRIVWGIVLGFVCVPPPVFGFDLQINASDLAEGQFPATWTDPASGLQWVAADTVTGENTITSVWTNPESELTGQNSNTRNSPGDSCGGWTGTACANPWPANPWVSMDGTTRVIKCLVFSNPNTGSDILADQFDLTNYSTATISGTFRVAYVVNATAGQIRVGTGMKNSGLPILSLQFANGPAFSLNVANWFHSDGSDDYVFILVQYYEGGKRFVPMPGASDGVIAHLAQVTGRSGFESGVHSAKIMIDNSAKLAQFWWDGTRKWDNGGQPLEIVDPDMESWHMGTSRAVWGCSSLIQPTVGQSSGLENVVFFQTIRLQDEGVCGVPVTDADQDGDVDMKDFATLQRCLGPTVAGGSPTMANGRLCSCFDRAGTGGEVDSADVALFTNCASGPGIAWQATPGCPN